LDARKPEIIAMDPLTLTKLQNIMNISKGDPNITIGLIDGPVDLDHAAFEESAIKSVDESQTVRCNAADSMACIHGTFVSGILCAKRGLSAPAICPGCTIVLRPIFSEKLQTKNSNINNYFDSKKANQINNDAYFPSSSPDELAKAIVEVVDKGAKIINLSLGLSNSSLTLYTKLQEAYDYARKKDVIVVAASGNQGNIGGLSLIENDWIIPVAACDEYGKLNSISNIGSSIRTRGLMAPGINITSTYSRDSRFVKLSGTSFAAPFVTGAIALLWSIFPKASAGQLVYSIRNRHLYNNHNRSIIPPLLNVEAAYNILKKMVSK